MAKAGSIFPPTFHSSQSLTESSSCQDDYLMLRYWITGCKRYQHQILVQQFVSKFISKHAFQIYSSVSGSFSGSSCSSYLLSSSSSSSSGGSAGNGCGNGVFIGLNWGKMSGLCPGWGQSHSWPPRAKHTYTLASNILAWRNYVVVSVSFVIAILFLSSIVGGIRNYYCRTIVICIVKCIFHLFCMQFLNHMISSW